MDYRQYDDQTKKQLKRFLDNQIIVLLSYVEEKGKITLIDIQVREVNEDTFKAYCIKQNEVREFKISKVFCFAPSSFAAFK